MTTLYPVWVCASPHCIGAVKTSLSLTLCLSPETSYFFCPFSLLSASSSDIYVRLIKSRQLHRFNAQSFSSNMPIWFCCVQSRATSSSTSQIRLGLFISYRGVEGNEIRLFGTVPKKLLGSHQKSVWRNDYVLILPNCFYCFTASYLTPVYLFRSSWSCPSNPARQLWQFHFHCKTFQFLVP